MARRRLAADRAEGAPRDPGVGPVLQRPPCWQLRAQHRLPVRLCGRPRSGPLQIPVSEPERRELREVHRSRSGRALRAAKPNGRCRATAEIHPRLRKASPRRRGPLHLHAAVAPDRAAQLASARLDDHAQSLPQQSARYGLARGLAADYRETEPRCLISGQTPRLALRVGRGVIIAATRMALLEVRDLSVAFETRDGLVRAVSGVSFSLDAGRVLALLGESGSGKSVTLRALLGLHSTARARVGGEVLLKGRDVNRLDETEREQLRGGVVSMVFQEPMTALDPVYTIGEQIVETLVQHRGFAASAAVRRARELLDLVQVPSPERCLASYPHEISGGMRQRAMIAIALACEPELLLAD